MIIKSHGIRSGTAERVSDYVMAKGANELVEVLEGASEALMDADSFAKAAGQKNGVLHITISPEREIGLDELRHVTVAINSEFGFSPEDPTLLVRHVSTRQNGKALSHYHLVRPAADANGRVYDVYRSKKKDETVSRLTEIKLGHELTSGKHSDFVHQRFLERGLMKHAKQIAHLVNVKPEAAMNAKQNQRSKRLGFDILQFAAELKSIAELPSDHRPAVFASLLKSRGNLTVEQGSRRSRLLVGREGEVLCNANRFLKIPAPAVAAFLEQTIKEIQNEKLKPNNNRGQQGERFQGGRVGENSPGTKEPPDFDGGNTHPGYAGRRETNSGSRGNPDTQSTGRDRRQSHHQKQYGCNRKSLRRHQDGLSARRMSVAARIAKPMIDDLKAVTRDYCAASVEPMPDLDDPFLMMKLSRMLARSMAVQACI